MVETMSDTSVIRGTFYILYNINGDQVLSKFIIHKLDAVTKYKAQNIRELGVVFSQLTTPVFNPAGTPNDETCFLQCRLW